MRLPQPFLIAAIVAAAPPASAQLAENPLTRAYAAELARQCPAKHLERLNPGILADPAGDFFETLTPDQKLAEQQIYEEQCADAEVGASCGNYAILRAAARFNLIPRLAAYVCKTRYACTAPYECHTTRR